MCPPSAPVYAITRSRADTRVRPYSPGAMPDTPDDPRPENRCKGAAPIELDGDDDAPRSSAILAERSYTAEPSD